MSKAIILFAPGLEECEGLITVDILRRTGCEVDIVSITDDFTIEGSKGIKIVCDKLINNTNCLDYDAIILPGGGIGVDNLSKSEKVKQLILDYNNKNKTIAAVCAAPTVLSSLGLLKNKSATVHHGRYAEMDCKNLKERTVVTDGNIITGSGLGTTIPFAFAISEKLQGLEATNNVKDAIEY